MCVCARERGERESRGRRSATDLTHEVVALRRSETVTLMKKKYENTDDVVMKIQMEQNDQSKLSETVAPTSLSCRGGDAPTCFRAVRLLHLCV